MTRLLIHGDIHTMSAAMPAAEAAVIEHGRFAYVGTEEGARLWLAGRKAETVDAGGMSVIPGLNDAHLHYLHTAMREANVNLSGATSVEAVIARLREGLAAHQDGWLIGEGWNQEDFSERRLITRADVDRVSTSVPIMASRACGHVITVNSKALEIAGLDVADGIFREDEQAAIRMHMPVPDNAALIGMMASLQAKLFAQGITSIQTDDLGSVPKARGSSLLTAVRDATEAGLLKMRYAEQALIDDPQDMQAFLAQGLHAIQGERFHVAHMKILADGSLGARTAWLRAPYADAPDTRGIGLYTDAAMDEMVRLSVAHGMPVAIHAIGDAAMEQALGAISRHGGGLRHAIVHAQIMDMAQALRCGQLGLSILAQPIFLEADAPIVRARVGDALAASSYRWRTMAGGGAHLALSTDCPVEPFDVMPNLYCAITRMGPKQQEPYLPAEGLPLAEALYAYTAAGAYVSGEEGDKGRIAAGQHADFVVLDKRLDPDNPAGLLDTRVAQTYIGGALVYSA